MIIDFFASISFYLIPFLTGSFFTRKIVKAWIFGALIWFGLYFLIFGIAALGKLDNFVIILRVIAIVISAISIIRLIYLWIRKRSVLKLKRLLAPLFLVVFFTLVYFLIWKRNTPYPMPLNWDIYEHITLANLILKGNLSFITSKISDTFTFNSYSPFFEILLSLPKLVFERSLLGIYWWLEYWHYLITILASYILAKKIFPNIWLALASALVSGLVFESIMAYSSLFLIPQTLTAVIAILVFKDIKEHKLPFLIIAGVLIFLMHYVLGTLSLFILFLGFIFSRYQRLEKYINPFVIFSSILAVVLLAINLLGKWKTVNIEEAGHFNFPLLDKIGFLSDWYGVGSIIFLIIGYFIILRKGNLYQKLALGIALLVFGIAFAPFSYFLKFFVLGRYFLNLVIAAGIFLLISKQKILFKTGILSIIAFSLLLVFDKNQANYKESLHFKNYVTQASFEEINASKWLFKHKKEGDFLISDPATQYIFEASSEVNTQGGVYMNLQTRKLLSGINYSNDRGLIKNKLLGIEDLLLNKYPKKRTLFILSGRYFAWQDFPETEKESSFYNVWAPRLINEKENAYIDYLLQDNQFKLLYRNDQVAILELL